MTNINMNISHKNASDLDMNQRHVNGGNKEIDRLMQDMIDLDMVIYGCDDLAVNEADLPL